MKKNLSKIFALLILIVIVGTSLPAYAASLSVDPSSSKVSVGDEITVTISLNGSEEAKSGGIEINYDGSLAYVSGSAKFNLQGATLVNYDEKTNKGAFAYSSATSISGDILTLKFTARYDGTPSINAKLTLRNGNDVVLEESAKTSITVGSGVTPTGSDTTAATTAQGQTTAFGETTEGSGESIDIAIEDNESTTYGDASNSIFRRADGSLNITLIVLIIAAILIVITVLIVVRYNKKEKDDSDKNPEKETKEDFEEDAKAEAEEPIAKESDKNIKENEKNE